MVDILAPNGYTVRTGASSFARQPSTGSPSGSALAATPPATGAADIALAVPVAQLGFYADIDYAYPQSRSVATAYVFRTGGGNAYSLWILAGQSLAIRYGPATGAAGGQTDIQNVAIPSQLPASPSGVPAGATRLSLIVDGQVFTVLMNGRQLMQFRDDRITSNEAPPQLRVSRFGQAPNESGTIVISNFQVYQLGS